jgi:hypothetical protein
VKAIPTSVPFPQRESAGYSRFVWQLLSDREQFYSDVVEGGSVRPQLGYALSTLLALGALYGVSAGAYAGPLQALSSAAKFPALFLGTLAICFPGFFVVQVLVGSRLRFGQVLALVLGALALTSILLASVVPVTCFFLFTGANYYFLELLHVAIVFGSGLVGMAALHEGLAFACEKRGVYPRNAMTIMKVWAVLFAFVGIQMGWNLRPFLGDRGEPFQVFRRYEGNFYTTVALSAQRLLRGEDKPDAARPARDVPRVEPGLPPPAAPPATP